MMILKRSMTNFKLRIFLVFILAIFLVDFISSECDEGQIDINSALLEDLDKLTGVGPTIAQNIINSRPFNSLDDLKRVSGLGGTGSRLADIKAQGLACVEEEKEEVEEEPGKKETTIIKKEEDEKVPQITAPIPIQLEPIKLNSKDIKSEENSEGLDKNKYAVYGFTLFCVLILFLFFFRRFKLKKHGFE